jgi:hypothetical protein
LNQRPVLLLAQYFLPALVRRPFVPAFPIDIFLTGETLRKIAQKLVAAPFRAIRDWCAKRTAIKTFNILRLDKAPCGSEFMRCPWSVEQYSL